MKQFSSSRSMPPKSMTFKQEAGLGHHSVSISTGLCDLKHSPNLSLLNIVHATGSSLCMKVCWKFYIMIRCGGSHYTSISLFRDAAFPNTFSSIYLNCTQHIKTSLHFYLSKCSSSMKTKINLSWLLGNFYPLLSESSLR